MELSGQVRFPAILPRCQLDKSWVDTRTGKGAVEKKNLDSARNRTQAVVSVARRYTDYYPNS
jgi:hypothetical protein